MSPATAVRTVVIGIVTIALIIAASQVVKIHRVGGQQMAVVETWNGVSEDPLMPGTYVKFPGFYFTFFNYDTSQQIYVMNDKPASEEFGRGRHRDAYTVQSAEGQDMKISLQVQWRINSERIVDFHKKINTDYEEKLLRPNLMRIVKDEATTRKAIDAYSGPGLVELQTSIEKRLGASADLGPGGMIIVDNFVIEEIDLDPEYISEIKERQVAVQRELRAAQEEKAALAEAQRAKAEAQSDFERALVEAERDKQVGVLEAEKLAEQEVLRAEAAKKQVVLQAEAEKESQVLAAEAEKESGELRAQAILALGEAEAAAKKLQFEAYGAIGAEKYVQVEVARAMAEAFKNISGYLPADMQINVLSSSFMRAIESIGGAGARPTPASQ